MANFKKPFEVYDRVTSNTVGESMTHQSFAAESNINNIIAKYRATGLVDHVNKYAGQYGDFSTISDYQSSLNAVLDAQEAFASLPANIRARFENDPGEFLSFVDNPDNREEMISLGLMRTDIVQNQIDQPLADNS